MRAESVELNILIRIDSFSAKWFKDRIASSRDGIILPMQLNLKESCVSIDFTLEPGKEGENHNDFERFLLTVRLSDTRNKCLCYAILNWLACKTADEELVLNVNEMFRLAD